jgi:RNA polymerase sigma-70 factor (ECF subfamily)
MRYSDEKQLIEALQDPQQQRAAFEEVVRSYRERLYWQIRRMVLSHEDANDLLQNTFIKAWTNLDYFRGEAKLSTWLYRIALNECLNFLSRQQNLNSLQLDDPEGNLANQVEGDPYFDGEETQLQLQRAVEALPEKQQLVFRMKYFQEMKYEEMSEILGNSVGALKASYFHAVKKISAFFNTED